MSWWPRGQSCGKGRACGWCGWATGTWPTRSALLPELFPADAVVRDGQACLLDEGLYQPASRLAISGCTPVLSPLAPAGGDPAARCTAPAPTRSMKFGIERVLTSPVILALRIAREQENTSRDKRLFVEYQQGGNRMRLSRIIIKNFRRISYADIVLEPASFLIGQNNHGKSSVIKAIEILLGATPTPEDFRKDSSGNIIPEMELIGYFSGIDHETATSRGFKGRVINGQFCYIKRFNITSPTKPIIECLEYPYTIKEEYRAATTGQDLVDLGLNEEQVKKVCTGADLNKKLKTGWEREFLDIVADFDMTQDPKPVANPGGIPPVVLSKLPQVIHVEALTEEDDIDKADKNTLVSKVLGILFEDLLAGTELSVELQKDLQQLEEQMSPDVEGSIINTLRSELNRIIGSVFPGCGIDIKPSLAQGLGEVLKPRYHITLYSNVHTGAAFQGTGLLRTAVFAMLRYHAHLKATHGSARPLLVAFEEPELYMHPSAANLLRNTIYELGASDQIVCTTHSPWMIDLSRDLQSLTKMVVLDDGSVTAVNYGVSEKLLGLEDDDRTRVKMLQLFDDEMSRVFFTDKVVVVEGDSEVIALKQTIKLLPDKLQKEILASTHIAKARGKTSIISLVKYLNALSIRPIVIHDRDQGVAGAEAVNEKIAAAVGDPDRLIVLEECIEDALGYKAPSSDKPYRVYQRTTEWKRIEDIPVPWFDAFCRAFGLDKDSIYM